MTDITPVLQLILAFVAIVFTVFLIPWIKSKTTAEQQRQIDYWIKTAVEAAEQIFVGRGRGEEKKNYVLCWLEEYNIEIDEDKLNAMVEAAVYQMNNNIGYLLGEPESTEKDTEDTKEE